ncbi:hypothetical protein IKQ19_12695 [Candidatus Saccharibacteria bacterium]|nr:hypothetical protein [Candidatus Saccharibacteria bacterium]
MNKKNPFETNEKPIFDDKKNLSVSMTPFTNGMSSEAKKELAKYAIGQEFGLQKIKLWAGIGLCFLGFVCLILGIFDIIDFEISSKLLNAKIVNASPGVIFAIIGVFLIHSANGKIK